MVSSQIIFETSNGVDGGKPGSGGIFLANKRENYINTYRSNLLQKSQ